MNAPHLPTYMAQAASIAGPWRKRSSVRERDAIVRAMYDAGASLREIGRALHYTSASSVRAAVLRTGGTMRKRGVHIKRKGE